MSPKCYEYKFVVFGLSDKTFSGYIVAGIKHTATAQIVKLSLEWNFFWTYMSKLIK